MVGKKVSLQFISNAVKRKATFRRRLQGLLKKAHELSTLCDVKVCLIVYGPNEVVPVVWPSISEAAHILRTLKEMSWIDQSRNMMNQELFMKSRIENLENQVRKMTKENSEMEMQILMNDCLAGRRRLEGMVVGVKELTCLGRMVEIKLDEVKGKMAEYHGNLVDEWLIDYDSLNFNNVNAACGSFGNTPCNVLNPIIGNVNPDVDPFAYFSMN